MAYKIRKVRGKDCYKVYNSISKHVFAKCTTKEKATRQMNLLKQIVYNNPSAKTRKKKHLELTQQ